MTVCPSVVWPDAKSKPTQHVHACLVTYVGGSFPRWKPKWASSGILAPPHLFLFKWIHMRRFQLGPDCFPEASPHPAFLPLPAAREPSAVPTSRENDSARKTSMTRVSEGTLHSKTNIHNQMLTCFRFSDVLIQNVSIVSKAGPINLQVLSPSAITFSRYFR